MDSENDWQMIVDLIEEESAAFIKLPKQYKEEIIQLGNDEKDLTLQMIKPFEAEDRLLIDLLGID
jgi:hypothetical protein